MSDHIQIKNQQQQQKFVKEKQSQRRTQSNALCLSSRDKFSEHTSFDNLVKMTTVPSRRVEGVFKTEIYIRKHAQRAREKWRERANQRYN